MPIEGADWLRGQILLVQQLEVPGHALRDAVDHKYRLQEEGVSAPLKLNKFKVFI